MDLQLKQYRYLGKLLKDKVDLSSKMLELIEERENVSKTLYTTRRTWGEHQRFKEHLDEVKEQIYAIQKYTEYELQMPSYGPGLYGYFTLPKEFAKKYTYVALVALQDVLITNTVETEKDYIYFGHSPKFKNCKCKLEGASGNIPIFDPKHPAAIEFAAIDNSKAKPIWEDFNDLEYFMFISSYMIYIDKKIDG